MTRKRLFASTVALVLVLMLGTGCALFNKTSTNPTAPTSFQKAVAYFDAAVQLNNSIEHGAMNAANVGAVPAKDVQPIVNENIKLAGDFEKINAILAKGQASATSQSAQLQALVADVQSTLQDMVKSGGLNIKNPTSQTMISADVASFGTLVQLGVQELQQTGVLK